MPWSKQHKETDERLESNASRDRVRWHEDKVDRKKEAGKMHRKMKNRLLEKLGNYARYA